jgi:hypothetical protein
METVAGLQPVPERYLELWKLNPNDYSKRKQDMAVVTLKPSYFAGNPAGAVDRLNQAQIRTAKVLPPNLIPAIQPSRKTSSFVREAKSKHHVLSILWPNRCECYELHSKAIGRRVGPTATKCLQLRCVRMRAAKQI